MSNKRIDTTFSSEERKNILEQQGGYCALCGLPVDANHSETHHAIPIGLNGVHDQSNALVMHPECHEIADILAQRGIYMTDGPQMMRQLLEGGQINIQEIMSSFTDVFELPDEIRASLDNLPKLEQDQKSRVRNKQAVGQIFKNVLSNADELYELGKQAGIKWAQKHLIDSSSSNSEEG